MPTRTRTCRGATILENMLAMALLLISASGVATMQRTSATMMADSRKLTRATAFASDLAAQIQLWEFTDARLGNSNTANDADVGDSLMQFQTMAPPPADHAEADLTLGGLVWTGLPQDLLVANGMERYWNISPAGMDSNGNGVLDGLRYAVIVRWPVAGGWRRVVIVGVKQNTEDRL